MKSSFFVVVLVVILVIMNLCSCFTPLTENLFISEEYSFSDMSVGETTSPGIDGYILKLSTNFGLRIQGKDKDMLLYKYDADDSGLYYTGIVEEVYTNEEQIVLVTTDSHKYIVIESNIDSTNIEYFETYEEISEVINFSKFTHIDLKTDTDY